MKREITITKDGSKTLFISELNEGYHSYHGALQEAEFVFIKNGLNLLKNSKINILEMGFGTGLNLLVTINNFLTNQSHKEIHYISIEKYPVSHNEIAELGYSKLFDFPNAEEIYQNAHLAEWNKKTEILPNFFLTKWEADFFDIPKLDIPKVDLVYYDCFGARVQPDLWEKPLFEIVTEKMNKNSLLTTYSSKGSVRIILKELGLEVEKRPGPPGKREMMIAWKSL